jgi:lipoate-protein ligase A
VLQHGAIPLEGDVARISDVLLLPEPDKAALRATLHQKAVSLEAALGRKVSFAECVEALRAGFAQALNLTLVKGELIADEWTAVELLKKKHTRREWLFDKAASRMHG